ncbi:hypothetical protein PIB30_035991 [Stylosanthes scabra]|uniref:Uncharacterized protein n=1 Tax=Stylosanthes scabra TaxID=79078 RepID=A0ABU6UDI7_9FABA|nr:hypothetical protein [Stylosanthes scabra]
MLEERVKPVKLYALHPASIVAVLISYEVRHGSMTQVLGNLVTAASYSWEPRAETRTPSNTCSKYAVRKGYGTFRTTTTKVPAPSGRVSGVEAKTNVGL